MDFSYNTNAPLRSYFSPFSTLLIKWLRIIPTNLLKLLSNWNRIKFNSEELRYITAITRKLDMLCDKGSHSIGIADTFQPQSCNLRDWVCYIAHNASEAYYNLSTSLEFYLRTRTPPVNLGTKTYWGGGGLFWLSQAGEIIREVLK